MTGDPEELRRRLEADPTDQAAFIGLRDLYVSGGHNSELAELLEYRATYGALPPESADLYYRAGEIWLDRVGDHERGEVALRRALEKDPLMRSAVDRLDALYREIGDSAALLRLFEEQIEALEAQDPGPSTARLRAHYYQQIGEIWAKTYDRDDQAISYFHRAFELDRNNVMALYCARDIYQKVGDDENATKLLDFEARAETDSARRVALYRELAHARAERLGDIEGAVVALKRARAIEPSGPEVMSELALMLLRRAPIGGGDSDRWLAADLLYQVATSSFASGEADSALAYCETALDAWPEHDGTLGLMEQICRSTGRLDLLADRYARLVEPLASSPMLAEVYRRAGDLAVERGELDEAIGYYEALEPLNEPGDQEVLADLYRRAGHGGEGEARPSGSFSQPPSGSYAQPPGSYAEPYGPSDEVEAYPEAGYYPTAEKGYGAGGAGPYAPDTVAHLREMAQMLRSQGREDEAEARMGEILELEPGDPEATSYLERRYRSRNDWYALHGLLLQAGQSQKLTPTARVLRLREAAGIAEERLKDPDAAVEAYRLACVLDPDDGELRRQLERLLKAAGRWDDLIDWIEGDAARAETSAAKIELLRQIADIHWNRREDPSGAADTWRRILEIRPDDSPALEALDEIFLREAEWESLAEILRRRRELSAIDAEKASIDLRLASVLSERLDQPEEAYEACRQAIERVPDKQEALSRMEAIDTAAGNWKRLIDTLQYRAELASGEDRAELIGRAALVAEKEQEDFALAAELWERVIEIQPDGIEALVARARCFELDGRWEEALDSFRELAAVASEQAMRLDVLRRIARLLEERGTREEAAEAWQTVLAEGDDAEACEALAGYFEDVGDHEQLVEVLAKAEGFLEDPDHRREVMLHRARVLGATLGAPEKAVAVLEQILDEVDPESREALEQLRHIHSAGRDFARAVEVAERELELIEDVAARTELLLTCAEWYRKELEDLPRAIRANERVLEIDPYRSDVIASLEDLYIAVGDWERLLGLIRGRFKASDDDEERVRLLEAGAEICEERLEDPDRAWAWYRELFDLYGERPEILEQVEDAARRLGLPRALVAIYGELAQNAASDVEQAGWWKKIGALYASPIGDHPRALEAMLRGFALDPTDTSLLDSIDEFSLVTGAHERLVRVYEALIEREEDPEAEVEIRRRLARVLVGRGGDPSLAFDQLMIVRKIQPDHPSLLPEIERAAEASERWEELLVILDEERQRTDSEGDKIDLLLRASQVVQEHLNAPDRAFSWVLEVVKIDPGDEHIAGRAMQVIDGLERDAGPGMRGRYWSQLIELYRALIRETDEQPEVQVRFYEVIARIQEDYLDDGRAAFETRRAATLAFPGHQPSLQALERLANRLGLWAELSRHYTKALEVVLDRQAAIDLHGRRARLLTEELDRPLEAVEHYWQLIQIDPSDLDTRQKLSVIYQKAGRWNDLMMLLEKELPLAGPERRREILLEIAGIWEYRLENRYEALDAYRRVLRESPDDDDARRAVERLEKPPRKRTTLDEDALAELGLLDDAGPPEFDDDDLALLEEDEDELPDFDGDSLLESTSESLSPALGEPRAGPPPSPEPDGPTEADQRFVSDLLQPARSAVATPADQSTGASVDVDFSSMDIVAEEAEERESDVEELDPDEVEELDPDDFEEIEPDTEESPAVESPEPTANGRPSAGPPPLPKK